VYTNSVLVVLVVLVIGSSNAVLRSASARTRCRSYWLIQRSAMALIGTALR